MYKIILVCINALKKRYTVSSSIHTFSFIPQPFDILVDTEKRLVHVAVVQRLQTYSLSNNTTSSNHVYLLDIYFRVFLWVGQSTNSRSQRNMYLDLLTYFVYYLIIHKLKCSPNMSISVKPRHFVAMKLNDITVVCSSRRAMREANGDGSFTAVDRSKIF